MALTTLSALKLHLGIASSDTSEDAFLTQLLASVEACVSRLCGNRQFVEGTYTEILDSSGTDVIYLTEWPVSEITHLYLDEAAYGGSAPNAFAASTELEAGVGFYLVLSPAQAISQYGEVRRIGASWPRQYRRPAGMLSRFLEPVKGCIKVVYEGGFENVPADVQLAVWQICAERRLRAANGQPMQSESDEGYSYSLGSMSDTEALMVGGVASLLGPYKPVRRYLG